MMAFTGIDDERIVLPLKRPERELPLLVSHGFPDFLSVWPEHDHGHIDGECSSAEIPLADDHVTRDLGKIFRMCASAGETTPPMPIIPSMSSRVSCLIMMVRPSRLPRLYPRPAAEPSPTWFTA